MVRKSNHLKMFTLWQIELRAAFVPQVEARLPAAECGTVTTADCPQGEEY